MKRGWGCKCLSASSKPPSSRSFIENPFQKIDIAVVGCSALSGESLQEISAAASDVPVIDSFTTNLAHVEFVREVRQSVPDLKLVMIGMETGGQQFLPAIREGAMGYIVNGKLRRNS